MKQNTNNRTGPRRPQDGGRLLAGSGRAGVHKDARRPSRVNDKAYRNW
jgi:hypothetical protein